MAEHLPILVALTWYPRALDGKAGNRLAVILSHMTSACIAEHGAPVPTVSLGTLVGQVEERLRKGDAVAPPEEVGRNLIAAAGALLAMLRRWDDLMPLPPAEGDCDMEISEPEMWVGPRHDLPMRPKGGARG